MITTRKQKDEYLKELVYEGAKKKNLTITDIVLDRIHSELSIIIDKEFTDYFILYYRIVEICNNLNLIRSYGRGSAANSIVNYCLDITKINPIEANLIFERFIRTDRTKLPDIDIDIPRGFKSIILDKLKEKYPEYNNYYIALPAEDCADNTYHEFVHKNAKYKEQPFGIIITTDKLNESIIIHDNKEYYIVYDRTCDCYYENKIDLVELEYLNRITLISNELDPIYHPYNLPKNDKSVFDFLTNGDLSNIFQLNSDTPINTLKLFEPDSIEDLAIINAMNRPGAYDFLHTIIRNKHFGNLMHLNFDKRLEVILDETYGLPIYQETFLQIANEIAGMSYRDAEIWRLKVSWNKWEKRNDENITNAFFTAFYEGCLANSTLSKRDAERFTYLIIPLIPYLFFKSHSLSYANISYWGAYYKKHFRQNFENAFSKLQQGQFQPFEFNRA
jgi:DNA polymerase III alpha subunit